jgi:hypothetical protein
MPSDNSVGNTYGAYSYICSRNYREYIIQLGIDFYVNNNINYDMSFNALRNESLLKKNLKIFDFYCHKHHIFIPEVRKDGINSVRTDDYYKDRSINLSDYNI